MISLIVAMDKNFCIGKDNQLLCHIPEDLKYFKQKTTDKIIVMGRKTFESIGKPLPNRTNIVLTKDPSFSPDGCYIYDTITDIIHEYNSYALPDEEVFIIGGQSIYEQFLPHADRLYITHINHEFDGDAFFPSVDFTEWDLIESRKGNECDTYDYYFNVYNRK